MRSPIDGQSAASAVPVDRVQANYIFALVRLHQLDQSQTVHVNLRRVFACILSNLDAK